MSDSAAPWYPLRLEQSNLQVWRRIQQLPFAEQWEWYEARYRYLQNRQTIRGRREARRRAYNRNHGVSPAARSRRRTVRRVRVRQEQVREERRRGQRPQQEEQLRGMCFL